VSHVVPDIEINLTSQNGNSHSSCAWADAAIIIPWIIYHQFGDSQVIRDQFVSMKAWIDCMQRYQVENSWPLEYQFGDWVALDGKEGSCRGATSNQYICDAFQIYSTRLFSIMAEAIGKQGIAKHYRDYEKTLLDRFGQTYLDEESCLTERTQTAHIIALHFSLVSGKAKEKVTKGLLALLEERKGHLVTGFIGTPYFCHALSNNGQKEAAFKLLLQDDFPSWLYQVKKGATTVWENWDGIKPDGNMCSPDMNSFNHYAYGTIGEWIYANIGGIVSEKPGFQSCIVKPLVSCGLSMAKMTYRSIKGPITVQWEKKDKQVRILVSIPANIKATIILEACKDIISSDGLDFHESKAITGSGTYTIVYTLI
jgi:alpha-L-rhamnosidase